MYNFLVRLARIFSILGMKHRAGGALRRHRAPFNVARDPKPTTGVPSPRTPASPHSGWPQSPRLAWPQPTSHSLSSKAHGACYADGAGKASGDVERPGGAQQPAASAEPSRLAETLQRSLAALESGADFDIVERALAEESAAAEAAERAAAKAAENLLGAFGV